MTRRALFSVFAAPALSKLPSSLVGGAPNVDLAKIAANVRCNYALFDNLDLVKLAASPWPFAWTPTIAGKTIHNPFIHDTDGAN